MTDWGVFQKGEAVYRSPGVRCERHKDIGITFCNLCVVEKERDEKERLRAALEYTKKRAGMGLDLDAARIDLTTDVLNDIYEASRDAIKGWD